MLVTSYKEGELMKNSILSLIIFAICIIITSCITVPTEPDETTNNELNTSQPTGSIPTVLPVIVDEITDDNAAIQWVEPALEALMRQELDKPEGDLFPSDLDHIRTFRLIGDTHIAINYNFGSRLDVHEFDDKGMPLKDGIYELDGEQYTRGSISSLADFANFRNISDLQVLKNDLRDLRGLSSLEKLKFLRLLDCSIQSIYDLAELHQIDTLDISSNQITDIAPLGNLEKLSMASLSNNNIDNLDILSSLANLQSIHVAYNPIESIDFIRTLKELTTINISGTKVEDISILAEKTSLQVLLLKDMDVKCVDLATLTTLKKLHGLSVSQNQAELLNKQVIGEFKELVLLEIPLNDLSISEEDIAWLREQLPHCQINPTFDLQ